MNTRTSGSDLWSIASADTERELEESLFTAVRVEASQYWPVLAGATSVADFETRLDVIGPHLDTVTASVLDDDTDSFYPTLRQRLAAAFTQDFELLSERRTAQRNRHNAALQAEVRAELRAQAGAADGSEDPDFLEGPADGQSGPPSTGGTPGSEAADDASGDPPENDDSKGPNILPSEDVVNEVTGTFKTAANVNFERRHFQHIADGIKSAPVDEATRGVLANHFATHLAGTNANFNRDRFLKAATGSRLDFSRTARKAEVSGARDVAQVQAYMPENYHAYEDGGKIFIEGEDVAGWTLDDYVIPRLLSGLMGAKEIVDNPSTMTEGQNVYYEAAKDSDDDDDPTADAKDQLARGELGSGDADYSTRWVKKDHQGPGPKFKEGCHIVERDGKYDVIAGGENRGSHDNRADAEAQREAIEANSSLHTAYDDHNTGLHNPELDTRTVCSQCGNRAFDGQRCHACGYTGGTASLHTAYSGDVEWDQIMQDPRVKANWNEIRPLVSKSIESQMSDDFVEGVSSSDINHTFFDVASHFAHNYSGDWYDRTLDYFREDSAKYGSIDGQTWDTGEVALQFDNDYALYQAVRNLGDGFGPSDIKRLWSQYEPNASVDQSQVNWDAVAADIKVGIEEEAAY